MQGVEILRRERPVPFVRRETSAETLRQFVAEVGDSLLGLGERIREGHAGLLGLEPPLPLCGRGLGRGACGIPDPHPAIPATFSRGMSGRRAIYAAIAPPR